MISNQRKSTSSKPRNARYPDVRNSIEPDSIKYTAHDKERRICEGPKSDDEERSEFERDRARIIHSAAFRRLQGKTQVFTSGEGDFYRTRLTHSLEVGQIAKGLALRLGANTELVEAAALLHDIGHPPFGHAGEDELKKLMVNYGGFEANAQNVRLINELEKKSTAYHGLNLTRAVIDAQLKYKNAPYENFRKFIYADDLPFADWASHDARIEAGCDEAKARSFECQIMNQADDIAYAVHDLEDGLHAKYIDAFTFSRSDTRMSRVLRDLKLEFEDEDIDSLYNDVVEMLYEFNPSITTNASKFDYDNQRAFRKEMTTKLIHRYVTAAERVRVEHRVSNCVSSRYLYNVEMPRDKEIEIDLVNKIIWYFVITAPQVRVLEAKGKYIIRALFKKFFDEYHFLPDDWQDGLGSDTSERERARRVADYISGMTDDYAQKTYAKFFLPNHGSIYEII